MNLSSCLERSFEVRVCADLLSKRCDALQTATAGRRLLIVTTPTVFELYGSALLAHVRHRAIEAEVLVLALGERGKTVEATLEVCARAEEIGLDRRAALVAFGGGVCSDVVGLAASLIRRGIAHVRVPTTLIGQVDAGIGLKGGVNFRSKKNYLGCFHPPAAVLVDPAFLRTLSAREIRQGMAEIVKIALIRDAELFGVLERVGTRLGESGFADPEAESRLVVRRAIALMLEELEANPYEDRSLARLVDMGHSFSPLIESASGFAVPHGDAVAIDMALTCLIAANLGHLAAGDAWRAIRLLTRLGLPTDTPLLDLALCRKAVEASLLHRGGDLNLVVPTAIGRADFVRRASDLPESVLRRSLAQLREAERGARTDESQTPMTEEQAWTPASGRASHRPERAPDGITASPPPTCARPSLTTATAGS
jgi:3-dehydroquinate synthetase